MEYAIRDQDGSHVITLNGTFTFSDNASFSTLVEKLEGPAPLPVIIDLEQVGFIDSAALGMLLLLREEMQKHAGRIVLRRARGQVRKMFSLGKFEDLFTLED